MRIVTLALLIMIVTASCGAPKSSLKGAVISPTVAAADINLTDHNGQPFQLNSFSGKVALVFFGFSNCVDECPATLALIRQALETVGENSKDVAVVMVSTDPVRDTPQSMKEFMERFNPDFLGLLGTPDELAKTWQDYGVTVEDGGETHSPFTYVVDKKGNLRETFLPDTSSDDIAADLKVLLAEN
ncbi:MAG: SCO family protein [Leadbetterella sp.]|nr:SCO family protein [Leadbetterella sp.]